MFSFGLITTFIIESTNIYEIFTYVANAIPAAGARAVNKMNFFKLYHVDTIIVEGERHETNKQANKLPCDIKSYGRKQRSNGSS